MNATPEEWRQIPGYPDYEVSNRGRVKSWRKWNGGPAPRILKPQLRGGYLCVNLFRQPRRQESRAVHHLVMLAFVGPRPSGPMGEVIRHLDGDCFNNQLDNLAYGTFAENSQDMVSHGHCVSPMTRRTHCPQGHPYDEANTRRDSTGRRHCRKCRTQSMRQYRARLKARMSPE